MYNLLTCAWCKKKPISKEVKQQKWLETRNNRILRQRKNADDNYMYMDQKPSKQGFQGEASPYANVSYYSVGTLITFMMFGALFIMGGIYIIGMIHPDMWSKLEDEW